MSHQVEESIAVRVAILRRCSDGILEIEIKQGARVGVDEMGELLDAQYRLTPELASVLVDARGTVSMTREAIEMTSNSPANDLTAATAVLVDSPVSTLLGNFFLRFARPPYPARVFRRAEPARAWLLEHLEERP